MYFFVIKYVIIYYNNNNIIQYYVLYHRHYEFIFFQIILVLNPPPYLMILSLLSFFLSKFLNPSVLKLNPSIIISNRKQLRWLPSYATVYVLRTPQWDNVFELDRFLNVK